MRTMSPKGQELLDDLPPYYDEDPSTRTIQDVMGRELQRVEDAGMAIRKGALPQYADDTYGLLGLWELLLGLPVEPVGVAVSTRRQKVLSLLQGRRSGYGSSWVARMNAALGTTSWKYVEDAPNYTITITIPFGSGSYSATQVAAIARKITPANLIIVVNYQATFIVGESTLGSIL